MKYVCAVIFYFVCACVSVKRSEFPVDLQINNYTKDQFSVYPYPVTSGKHAKFFMEQREKSIADLLEPDVDPYRGSEATPQKCRPESLPQRLGTAGEWRTLSLYSSTGRILGLCDDPQNLLKTHYELLYCEKEKTVYIIRYYYSDNLPWIVEPIAKCRL